MKAKNPHSYEKKSDRQSDFFYLFFLKNRKMWKNISKALLLRVQKQANFGICNTLKHF